MMFARVICAMLLILAAANVQRSAFALATITTASWQNPVDLDGDGFARSADLTWNESSPSSLNVVENIFYRPTGSSTWQFFEQLGPHLINGPSNPQSINVIGGSHGSYDWEIVLYESGARSADDFTTSGISAFLMELPSEDVFAPVITSSLSATATVGTSFAYQITATNNPTVFNAVVAGRTVLPFGLSIDPSTGIISGTPIEFGQFSITLTATNGGGSGNATLALDIHYPARGAVGLPFYFYFYPTDNTGAGPISSTTLPPGLSLSPLDPTYATALVGKPVAAAIYGLPATAGFTSVTFTGQFTTETITATIDITIDPAPAPSSLITGITISRDPVRVNTNVDFTAVSQQLAQGAQTVFVFLQGSQVLPDGVQAPTTFGSGTVTRSFTTPGDYTAFAAVFDGFNVGFYTQNFTVEALDPSSNVSSVATGTVTNPNNGLGIAIPESLGGVLDFDIVDTGTTAQRDDTVLNEISGRSAVQGIVVGQNRKNFATKFLDSGIYVLQTTVSGRKARRMLPIGKTDLGQPLSVGIGPRDDSGGIPGRTSVSGKFFLSPAKADQVKLSGTVALPAGIDTAEPVTLDLGVGNVVETVTLIKGKGVSADGKVKLQLKAAKKGPSHFTITLTSPQLDTQGFDTEGISATPKSALNIQLAFVIEGVPYFKSVPVSARAARGKVATVQISGK